MPTTPLSRDRRIQPNYNTSRDVDLTLRTLPEADQATWRTLKRQHMVPNIEHGLYIDCYNVVEDPDVSAPIPYDQFVTAIEEDDFVKVTSEPYWAYGARFTAPGYLDCTDWTTHGSPIEAIKQLLEEAGDVTADEEE